MNHVLVMGLPLAAGLVLALLAMRRGWAPSLPVILATGAALRLVVMLIAARDDWQPWDLAVDFWDTATAVLAGADPITSLREGGWHFLPFMAYVLTGQRELTDQLGLPWEISARLVPVLADLALIPLVARLVPGLSPERRALVSFQYACAPIALMVSAIHGQFPPVTLLFGVAALLVARAGRPHLAGVLAGFAVTTTSWAVLLVPGVLLAAPAVRHRVAIFLWTGAVPFLFLLSSSVFLGTPVSELPSHAKSMTSARPVVGDWGWTAVMTGGSQEVLEGVGRIGTPLLVLAVLAAAWWWRKSDPATLTLVLLLAFLIVTWRFGTQYLAWPLPYLIALSSRGTWPAITAASIWSAFGYLYMTRLTNVEWRDAHTVWALSSLVVIAFLIYALPPRQPAPEPAPPSPLRPEPVGEKG